MSMTSRLLLILVLLLPAAAFAAEDQRWIGPDFFAMPLHDWAVEEGSVVARPASFNGGWANQVARLYDTANTVGESGTFTTTFAVRNLSETAKPAGFAGIWLGLKSRTPSPRNVWIHPPEDRIFVGIDEDGHLVAAGSKSERPLVKTERNDIHITGTLGEGGDTLNVQVLATPPAKPPLKPLVIDLPAGSLSGTACLVAQDKEAVWQFTYWDLLGDAVITDEVDPLGPILWTQYTFQDNGTLKLQAQMVPLETSDRQTATLEVQRSGRMWEVLANATLEPFSSTFLFRAENLEIKDALRYRVAYTWNDEPFFWHGSIRPNPKNETEFTLGVFNCDHGELFPQDTMVRNVTAQDPDMLFFAGDQIYEVMDKVRIVRDPLEGARLSYLSKYYQFGLTWRHLLKDRPSVIIPDDHDVFMGNIWGDGGRGYVMDPKWVNMIQRTQAGSLPDPVDPDPVARGIEVYFTALDYAGMSFAVIEDRKFKSSPDIARDVPRKPRPVPSAFDIDGATLLGDRQLAFLSSWTQRTEDLPARWFLSQTMFSKANTHTGSNLKRSRMDMDNNGWPQSARNRALRTLGRDTIMVHGDQHIGVLARMGIDDWDDGPLGFMVTGSSVGFPRAWWPDKEPEGGALNGPFTGRFIDDLGHKLTVHGVTNPQPLPPGVTDARNRPDYKDAGVFAIQDAKGSGHGLITIDKKAQTATFEAYRLDFDAAHPKATDQFAGFPVTLPLR